MILITWKQKHLKQIDYKKSWNCFSEIYNLKPLHLFVPPKQTNPRYICVTYFPHLFFPLPNTVFEFTEKKTCVQVLYVVGLDFCLWSISGRLHVFFQCVTAVAQSSPLQHSCQACEGSAEPGRRQTQTLQHEHDLVYRVKKSLKVLLNERASST